MKNPASHSGIFNPRVFVAVTLCSAGALLASFAAPTPLREKTPSRVESPANLLSNADAGASTVASPSMADGRWDIVPSPNASTQQNFLRGVTCVSATDCWAVGSYYNTTLRFNQTLTLHWDGSTWAVISSPNPISNDSALHSLTCVSGSDCWAVGSYYAGMTGDYQTLIEHWDGSAWAIVPSPNLFVNQLAHNFLNSVTCASATDCWAVGGCFMGTILNTDQTLIAHWDGSAWTLVSSPIPATYSNLFGVTCVNPSDCWAVGVSGNTANDGIFRTLTEHWDGTDWSVVGSPSTSALQSNVLYGVSCLGGSDCWTAGYYSNGTAYQTLIEHNTGSGWSIVSSPNTTSSRSNVLNSVSCVSGSDCWAAGYYQTDTYVSQTLIQHNTGSGWVVVGSPSTSASEQNYLNSIACVSASDCWAVGSYNKGTTSQTLIEHYTVPSAPLNGAVSRKTHGSELAYDIDLPLTGPPGIECRSGGASNAHQIVFKFAGPVTFSGATVAPSSGNTAETDGPPASSADMKEVTVNLKNVSDAQTLTITLLAVSDGNNSNDVAVRMLVLAGDTNEDTRVNVGDTNQTKGNSGSLTDAENFRTDVNLDGRINVGDTNFVKAHSGIASRPRIQIGKSRP